MWGLGLVELEFFQCYSLAKDTQVRNVEPGNKVTSTLNKPPRVRFIVFHCNIHDGPHTHDLAFPPKPSKTILPVDHTTNFSSCAVSLHSDVLLRSAPRVWDMKQYLPSAVQVLQKDGAFPGWLASLVLCMLWSVNIDGSNMQYENRGTTRNEGFPYQNWSK